MIHQQKASKHYTIPSNNRELRHSSLVSFRGRIIPYQVITGNYDYVGLILCTVTIIPYQVITGNYDMQTTIIKTNGIIPYQVITGNYDFSQSVVSKIKTAHGESDMIRLLSSWAVSQKNIYYS